MTAASTTPPTTPPHARSTLTVDVVSDVVCPWCYIGKRHLETTLAALQAREPGLAPAVRWHPFQLNPDIAPGGVDRRAYLEAKFGGPARADTIYARVRAAGEAAGLALALDAIRRQPNTRDAHRLIAWAQARDGGTDANPLVERLFRAYFTEGRDIGDRDELARLAADAGMDASAARELLESGRLEEEIDAANVRANALGIGGVPFIIFDGKAAVSGAQPPDVLQEAIAAARRR